MQGMVKRGEKEQNAPLASSPDSIPFVVPENKNKNNEDTKHNRFPFWELTPVVAGHADCIKKLTGPKRGLARIYPLSKEG